MLRRGDVSKKFCQAARDSEPVPDPVSFRAGDRCHWREDPPDERYGGTTSLAPRIYEGGGPRSGRGSPRRGESLLSHGFAVPAPPEGKPRELRSVLAPLIYEGGGPRSGRGSSPRRRRGRPSQSRFAMPALPEGEPRGDGRSPIPKYLLLHKSAGKWEPCAHFSPVNCVSSFPAFWLCPSRP